MKDALKIFKIGPFKLIVTPAHTSKSNATIATLM